eukprot:6725518-Prymnesium_polylepis.2
MALTSARAQHSSTHARVAGVEEDHESRPRKCAPHAELTVSAIATGGVRTPKTLSPPRGGPEPDPRARHRAASAARTAHTDTRTAPPGARTNSIGRPPARPGAHVPAAPAHRPVQHPDDDPQTLITITSATIYKYRGTAEPRGALEYRLVALWRIMRS